MAIDATFVAEAFSSSGANIDTVWTPSANTTYLAIYAWTVTNPSGQLGPTTPTLPSGSGNIGSGPTQISLNNTSTHNWFHGIEIWKMKAVASPSGTTTFRCPSDVNGQGKTAVFALSGEGAFASLKVQEKKSATDSPASLTLDAGTSTNNLLLTFYNFDEDTLGNITGGEGTEIWDSTTDPHLAVYKRTASTSTTVAIPTTSGSGTLVNITALELLASGAAAAIRLEGGVTRLGLEGGSGYLAL